MFRWLGIAILILSVGNVFAELGPAWNKTYGSAGYDEGVSLLQLSDGGYIVAGTINDAAQDLYVVRTDANGDSLWTWTENLNGIDKVFAITQTADGGFALTGTTSGPGQAFEAFIYRLDANGDSLWFRYYGGPLTEEGRGIIELPDGSLVMGGNSYSFGEGNGDFWLLKVSSTGDSLWSQTYGGLMQDELRTIDLALDGGFILGGSNESIGAGGADLWLVKTDSLGQQEWASLFGGDGLDWGYGAITTSDNNYLIVGRTLSFGFQDYYVVKVDQNGNEIWSESYNGGAVEWPFAVTETNDGGFAICGNTNFGGAGGNDVWILQIDALGQIVNSGLAGGTLDDDAYDIIQNSDGDFVFAGATYSFGAGESDLWLVKMTDTAPNNPPADFSRLTPTDGSTTSAFSIGFSWEEAEDVDLDTVIYLFDVWTPTFTTPEPASVETTATSITVQIPQPPDGTPSGMHDYFWTVSATDGIDTIEALNGQGMFTFNYVGPNEPPADFTRVYPADDSVVVSHNLVLSWTSAVDPNGDVVEYSFHIDSPTYIDAVPSNVVTQDTFIAVVIPVGGSTGIHDFTWTVEATDGEFTVEPTNGDGHFLFAENEPPGDFMRLTPFDCSLFTDNEITLSWSTSVDPDGNTIQYLYEVYTPTFTAPVPASGTTTDTSVVITIPAPPDTTLAGFYDYYWTVRATDGIDTVMALNGEGIFFYNYMMPNEPPGSFSRIYPMHDELISENEITLTWSSSIDPDGDSIIYTMNLMTETFQAPVPPAVVTGDTFAAITIPDPPEGTPSGIHEYLWSLYATDGIETVTADSGATIFWYQYTAPNRPPGEFSRLTPADSSINAFNGYCSWSSALDPDGDMVDYIFHIESAYPHPFGPVDTVISDTTIDVDILIPDTPLDDLFWFDWTVHATDGIDTVEAANSTGVFGLDVILASDELNTVAEEFSLQIYPNPFNPSTTIHYSLDQTGPVSITVTDILGRQVAELVNATMNPGSYTLNWTAQNSNGMSLPSGSYWVKLSLNQSTAVHRIILMR